MKIKSLCFKVLVLWIFLDTAAFGQVDRDKALHPSVRRIGSEFLRHPVAQRGSKTLVVAPQDRCSVLVLDVKKLTNPGEPPGEVDKAKDRISVKKIPYRTSFQIDDKPFAEFQFPVHLNPKVKIKRPYIANVFAPNGIQVTRHHPPKEGDSTDHADMHPGIWLAFGDLSGSDFWRNRAWVETILSSGRVDAASVEEKFATCQFTNRYYRSGTNKIICEEHCSCTIWLRPHGRLIFIDSLFRPCTDGDFYFGDQEEMGLGVRVATAMTVKSGKGGRILDSEGRINEKGIWGKQAKWCDYSGKINGKHVGVMIMPDPANFRPCWWHVRDYGLMVANPFGRNALTGGPKSKVIVKKGEDFSLRFGVLVHSGMEPTQQNLERAYQDYLQLLKVYLRPE